MRRKRAVRGPAPWLAIRPDMNAHESAGARGIQYARQPPSTAPRKLSRLVIPEECQRNQGDGDDPQHDVFTAVLFFGHIRKYSIPQVPLQVQPIFPRLVTALVRLLTPSCNLSALPPRAGALTAP